MVRLVILAIMESAVVAEMVAQVVSQATKVLLVLLVNQEMLVTMESAAVAEMVVLAA